MADTSPPSAQQPLRLRSENKRDPRTQFAGLPFRVVKDGKEKRIEVLLVTSRDTKRWIMPKGWPMDGMTPAEAAAQEVWEEAGAKGRAYDSCLGLFSYRKGMDNADDLSVIVAVFAIKVKRLEKDYPEASQRKRKWMSLKEAAKKISDKEARPLIASFSPDRLI